jgi:membrane-associated protease RseP (regulator of RpoE activity)
VRFGKRSDFDKVSRLIPLRVTGDLSVDEAQSVDQSVRYDDKKRTELESYTKAISILHEAAALPLPEESQVVRGEGSLWDRIESRLGPVHQHPSQPIDWFPTRYLVAACLGLICLTLAQESRRFVAVQPQVALAHQENTLGPSSNAAPTPTTNPVASAPQPPRIQVQVTIPVAADGIRMTEVGIDLARAERIHQRLLGLPHLDGVVVTRVELHSLGHKAGLLPGDCITAIDGQSIYAPKHAREVMIQAFEDGAVGLTILRQGKIAQTTIHGVKSTPKSKSTPDQSSIRPAPAQQPAPNVGWYS